MLSPMQPLLKHFLALPWGGPHWWAGGSHSLFFSFLPLPFSRICHLIAHFDFFQKSYITGFFFHPLLTGHCLIFRARVQKPSPQTQQYLDHLICKWTFIICRIITITPSPRLVFLFCSYKNRVEQKLHSDSCQIDCIWKQGQNNHVPVNSLFLWLE